MIQMEAPDLPFEVGGARIPGGPSFMQSFTLKPCGLRVRLRACGICKDYFRAQLLLDRLGTGAFHIVGADQVDPVAQDDPGDGGNNHEIIKIMFKTIFKDLVSYDPYTRFLAGTISIV